jgi:4-aminobutyrate aminotransferase/(S)-3-amino-2-methylpropionate transaminase
MISTNHRIIKTSVPHPEDYELIEQIKKYERSALETQLPLVWDRAVDSSIYDRFGNKFIDLSSSIFVTNSGHSNEESLKEIRKTLNKPLVHAYCYPTAERLRLLQILDKITPDYINSFRLVSTGTEATEVALRIARTWGLNQSKDKKVIIGGQRNYHGKTMGALMSATTPAAKDWIGYTDPNMLQMPFPYPWVLEKEGVEGDVLFERHINQLLAEGLEASRVTAFVVESYQGWGAIFYPKSYIQAMKNWCDKNNALFIADEIQSGFGRTGKLFCYEHYDVEPDIILCGKGISGSLPLSAVIGKAEVLDTEINHSTTHGGHPLSCAAAVGNLSFFIENNLVKRAESLEAKMHSLTHDWQKKFPHRISRIIGKGLVWGVFINKENSEDLDVEYVDKLILLALKKGVYSIRTGSGTIKIGPPLTISEGALDEAFQVYMEVMEELEIK